MEDAPESSGPSKEERWKEFREKDKQHKKEALESLKQYKLDDLKIVAVLTQWPPVNMKEVDGNEEWIGSNTDIYYANTHHLAPKTYYPPGLINNYGKDMAQNAQGIYYYDAFDKNRVPANRELFIPSFESVDWDGSTEVGRRKWARIVEEHMINNETFHKSEYAWEADAWSDIFGRMRNDNQLAIDKHECNAIVATTDPIDCTLTGESVLVKKIPDATFGLATYSPIRCGRTAHTTCDHKHCPSRYPAWNTNLRRDKLERLLLHRKCGLISDPKWGETDLVFPFMVYEAKGWSGDCREARRQACLAAAVYLSMLDELSRKPGPVGTAKIFQTETSHNNQVFALTSFGAQWHLLVAFKRPRAKEEHADMDCMSRDVYIFQRIWSGRVMNQRAAWELLSLIDQIHAYAITHFRDYVIQHLRTWHEYCDENYLLDWDSKYNVPRQKKRKRTCVGEEDLVLPSWTKSLSSEAQDKIQARAKKSMEKALNEENEYQERLKTVKKIFSGDSVARGLEKSKTSSDSSTEVRYRY